MNSRQIVQDLLQGSRNIDRMKKEVDQLVKMMLGFASNSNRRGCSEFEFYERLETDSCIWEVKGVLGSMNKAHNFTEALCTVKRSCPPPHEKHHILSTGYCSKGHVPFSSNNTQQVYESLHTFVEAMVKAVPGIEEEWVTFLKASQVFAPN